MTPSHASKYRDPEINNLQTFRPLQIKGIYFDCEKNKFSRD
jgi:hypothetical protein